MFKYVPYIHELKLYFYWDSKFRVMQEKYVIYFSDTFKPKKEIEKALKKENGRICGISQSPELSETLLQIKEWRRKYLYQVIKAKFQIRIFQIILLSKSDTSAFPS